MGSGATKINSNESVIGIEREKSSVAICSEKNNNVIAKKPQPPISSSPVFRPQSASGPDSKKLSHTVNQSSSVTKLPDLHTRKSKDILPETKVLSLKPALLEPINKDIGREKDAVARLNKELAASESQRLDLQEQIQLLEERLLSKGQQLHQSRSSNDPDSLQETLNAKDQYILKLEREATTNQADSNKLRIKLKKKIKALTNQVHETKQDASISQMELKAEITRQTEEINALKAGGSLSSSSPHEVKNQDQDHSKIIVELSNQLTEQADRISSLEAELSSKKKEISDLKLAISDHYDSKDAMSPTTENNANLHSSLLPNTSTDRLHSSRGRRVSKPGERSREQKTHSHTASFNAYASPTPLESGDSLVLHRQSTTLSDSDSDWDDHPAPPSHIHSAPARSRVKSAVSLASSDKHKGSMVTLNGNDDSFMDTVSALPGDSMLEHRVSSTKKKTALRNHLEKARVESQANSLIGPTLAFEKKADAFSDTSCEPTPRHKRTMLHTDPRVRIVKPIVH